MIMLKWKAAARYGVERRGVLADIEKYKLTVRAVRTWH
jgi:hypothetical protein